MLPFILTVIGGYFIGSALTENEDVSIFADGGNINDNLWESVKNKFSEIFYEEGYGDEIYSNEVKAEEYKWLFDRRSNYSSSLSWEDAEDKFLGMLTPEEKNIIKIEHNIVDSHELFGIMSEKKILVTRIMAKGGQIGDSARVIETNKSGVIMEKMGKKYLLKFVDGTEGIYEANELEFTRQYADGGEITEVFDILKKGNEIKVKYDDSIKKSNDVHLVVMSKNMVGKGKPYESEKITFKNINNPDGVKFYAYKRKNGFVYFAKGDMAITPVEVQKVDEENYKKGGTIKVGDKVRSTVFKDVEGEVLNKKGDMLFIRKTKDGDYEHDVLRINEVEKLSDGGILDFDEVMEIEVEVEKMTKKELLLEVELSMGDVENKFYFEYDIDRDGYSLMQIYDENNKPVSKELKKELESNKRLDNVLMYSIEEAIEDYHHSKYESDEYEPEEYEYAKGGKVGMSRKRFIRDMKNMHKAIKEITLKDGTKISGKEIMKDGGEVKKINMGDVVRIKNPNADENSEQLYVCVQDTSEYSQEDQIECQVIGEKWKDWHFKPISRIEMNDLEIVIPNSKL